MNLLIVIVAFAAIGGILAGYVTARVGPAWTIFALWVACAGATMGYAMFLDTDTGRGALQSPLVLYGILIPFSMCVVVSSVIGAGVRVFLSRRGAT
ncbi:hypothetical protein [Hasllibacter sp. MH4015]|uniref:hypothetical protein n=1 Tax=Hasllibacter sp. MH4015 TaxID=2854029 RepID=UPI001CD4C7D0|nr:hypothetical protein [Hasllibacter sp. MH4015]